VRVGIEEMGGYFPAEGGKGKGCSEDTFWYVQRVRSELKRLSVCPCVRVSVLGQANSDRFPYLPKNSNIFILKNRLRK